MKYYIITFDRNSEAKYGSFHKDFVNHHRISKWFHYIKSSYIVGTTLSVEELSDHYSKIAKEHGLSTTHLIMEVVLGNRQGRLTDDAWKWLQKNTIG